ncbi:MAG TPA: hypothetical protein VGO93_13160, partial [Candidatus Xenobia bacterium]
DTKTVRASLEEDGSINELKENILRRTVLEHIFQNVKVEKLEPPAETPAPAEAETAETPAAEPAAQS